jgi:hypothetical protein
MIRGSAQSKSALNRIKNTCLDVFISHFEARSIRKEKQHIIAK